MTTSSANGRGRTLYEILTGRNKKDSRPLELQYHNPLALRIGSTVSFEHEPLIASINFVVEAITVYQTKIQAASFYHTDYHLKGISLDQDQPIRYRMRLIQDENVENQLGHRLQLLRLTDEMQYDKNFHEVVLADPSGEFYIKENEQGEVLENPRTYWRVEDVLDPYNALTTLLRDADGNGTIEDDELVKKEVVYWDFSRLTDDPLTSIEFTEFLTIEMDKETGLFKFFVGQEVLPSQVAIF